MHQFQYTITLSFIKHPEVAIVSYSVLKKIISFIFQVKVKG